MKRGHQLGERVRRLREDYGLTQSAVAREWGRPQPNLSRIENGWVGVSDDQFDAIVGAILRAQRRSGS